MTIFLALAIRQNFFLGQKPTYFFFNVLFLYCWLTKTGPLFVSCDLVNTFILSIFQWYFFSRTHNYVLRSSYEGILLHSCSHAIPGSSAIIQWCFSTVLNHNPQIRKNHDILFALFTLLSAACYWKVGPIS